MSPAAAGDAAFNAWGVELLTPFGPAVPVVVAIAVLAGLALSLRGLHTYLAGWQRAVIAVMRAAAAAAVLALLLEPALVNKKVSRVRSRVAVLVDSSGSMELPYSPGGPSRREAAGTWLGDNARALADLSTRYAVSFHEFDVEARPMAAGAVSAPAPARGRGTDILRAIDTAAGGGDVPLSALMLVTDGADLADLAGALQPESGALHGSVRAFFKNLGAPVHVYMPGTEGGVRDVAITAVEPPAVAFTGVETEIAVTVAVSGFGAVDVPLVLRAGGQVVQTQTVKVIPGRSAYRAAFRYTPSRAANGVVTVSAPVLAGDADPSNNEAHAVLKVVRDRTRVLQVAGGPSWDVRFLRQFLKRSPGTDLISFFILRTLESQVNAPDDELSLIPFPTDEVFRGHIDTFDAVVFQDFNFSPYGMHGYLPGLAQFVSNGGGLLIAGGNRSLSTGEYRASAIDPALPVTLGSGERAVATEAFQPLLTAAGRAHPLTALSADPAEGEALWRNVPAMNGINVATAVRPGAAVLLAHPFLKIDGGAPAPVLAAWEYGKGRVALLMTDESWRWEFSEAAFGESRVYRRFYENMLKWLAGEPAFDRLRLDEATARVPGTVPVLRGAARGVDFGPLAGAQVRALLRPSAGGQPRQLQAETGPDGSFSIPLEGVPGGAYGVDLGVSINGVELARATQDLLVDTRDPERASPLMNVALMKAVAAASGGTVHFIPKESLASLQIPDKAREVVDRKEYRPLWDRASIAAALALLLAAEWFLRRRWGQQ